jgi:hypothetical protein
MIENQFCKECPLRIVQKSIEFNLDTDRYPEVMTMDCQELRQKILGELQIKDPENLKTATEMTQSLINYSPYSFDLSLFCEFAMLIGQYASLPRSICLPEELLENAIDSII